MTSTDMIAKTFTNVATSVKGGVITNFSAFVSTLSADGFALAGQEAEDFGTLVDDFTMGLEAGKSPLDAWHAAWEPYKAKAYSDAWNEAMTALKQIADFVHSIVTLIEAAI